MKKGLIKATDAFERIVHWSLALSCLLLCITGLGMMFHSFNFIGDMMGGLRSLKYVHNFTGLFFGVALYFTIRMWWKEAGVFSFPEDLDWIKVAGGYLWHVDKVPEVGKYNPGQKAFFLVVAGFGFGAAQDGRKRLYRVGSKVQFRNAHEDVTLLCCPYIFAGVTFFSNI